MDLSKLSENYYLRKHYIKSEQVPTQTVMKERMTPALANVYFKSMTPKLKVLGGLEPPMKGGGSDWYIPPSDLLMGRAVMKPIKKQFLSKLGFNAMDCFGDKLVRDHHKAMEEEKRRLLHENDLKWKATVEASCNRQWDDTSREQANQNTSMIQQAFHEFSTLYSKSLNNIEALVLDAAIKEIKHVEDETFAKMSDQYEELLKQQATMLYDRYTIRLFKEKTRQKDQFISTVENSRTEMGNKLHDINVEKRVAIERLRALLECQNLACQVYVALKEREECKNYVEMSQHKHKKAVKILTERVQLQDFEIRLAKEKEANRQNFITMWKRKVCLVVKKFQVFVEYCLNTLPECADFFINMEKLMLIQLGEAMENPSVESIFMPEEPTFHTPVPKPHPFFLFCDKGFKPKVDQGLCPKHCTSSASQFPVIIVNKRYIYAACDNFQVFSNKVRQFLDGLRGDDEDLVDDHDYTFDIPVKCTSTDQLLQLKLESSLMQVLQNEFALAENVKRLCTCESTCTCKLPADKMSPNSSKQEAIEGESIVPKDYGQEIKSRNDELKHEREPKWESYLEYVIPKRCQCAKTAKKHLEEHLPFYMRNMSKFEEPNLPHYKMCSVNKLRKLVKHAQRKPSPSPTPIKVESKTRSFGTQYSDQEFDFMCTCFSDEEIEKLFHNLIRDSKLYTQDAEQKFAVVDNSLTPTYLSQREISFAQDRVHSLRRLLDDAPELEEIFKKQDCDF